MLTHRKEFEQLGIPPYQLLELAEASTAVGMYAGMQRSDGRVVVGLAFHGMLVAVAISVGTNGFFVGMNRRSLADFAKLAEIPEGGGKLPLTTSPKPDFYQKFQSDLSGSPLVLYYREQLPHGTCEMVMVYHKLSCYMVH
jgi:hypothetical protein